MKYSDNILKLEKVRATKSLRLGRNIKNRVQISCQLIALAYGRALKMKLLSPRLIGPLSWTDHIVLPNWKHISRFHLKQWNLGNNGTQTCQFPNVHFPEMTPKEQRRWVGQFSAWILVPWPALSCSAGFFHDIYHIVLKSCLFFTDSQ